MYKENEIHEAPQLVGFLFLVPALIAIVLLSSGCAHTRLVSWNGAERTVCGNKFADEGDLKKEAIQACQGNDATALGGFQHSTFTGYSQGMTGFTGATVKANYKQESCVVYQCAL